MTPRGASRGRRQFAAALLTAMQILAVCEARAGEIYAGDDLQIRWDNTLTYRAGLRLPAADPITLAYPNSDDADRDFARGVMMNRLDLNSVLDIASENFGLQVSLNGWYDAVYQRHTGNDSAATYNPVSVPNSEFAHAVRALDGAHVELGDSFVYANLSLQGMPVSVRLGRQTMLWGEGLFFAANSIAAGQAPVDYVKGLSTPEGYSRSLFLPVNQAVLTVQPQSDFSLSAYYQFEWRPSRLAGVGSYFSDSDITGAGAERAFLSQGQYLLHGRDEKPSAAQFGFALRKSIEDIDLGFYALRFNAKYPVVLVDAAAGPGGYAGTFESYYPSATELYGASFSTYWGDSTVAGEISGRLHMPLVSNPAVSLTFLTPLRNPGYALGDTLHAQLSLVSTLGPQPFWDSADVSLEVAANERLAITHYASAFNTQRSRFAASLRALVKPHYFQVLPNLEVTPILGAGYHLTGRSSVDYRENSGTGDFELGVSFAYRTVWQANLSLTTFVGAPYRQALSDRDFFLVNLERAF